MVVYSNVFNSLSKEFTQPFIIAFPINSNEFYIFIIVIISLQHLL